MDTKLGTVMPFINKSGIVFQCIYNSEYIWFNSEGEAFFIDKEWLSLFKKIYNYEILDNYGLVYLSKEK